jgi:hypothetical protein
MVGTGTYPNIMMMSNIGTTIPPNTNTARTVSASNGRPWATAIVFKVDGNSSNQHIWNFGEGAGSTDDNIYLRLDSNRNLYFGWGRSGALNECAIGQISANAWYAVYVGYDGTRYSGTNATASNLANVFDIRLLSASGSWAVGSNLSTSSNWTSGSTGGRMDRQFTTGVLTIGGRGGNRNFHGKVASMVVTTLSLNVNMPTTAEIEMMITDPVQWLQDYKVGQFYRQANSGTNSGTFTLGNGTAAVYGTQIWLMGDGTSDSYANGIRNHVDPTDQNYTKLQLNSMVSNDLETVNINGLT